MGIRRLFMPGRYLRCRRSFRRPLSAHWNLAFVRRNASPFTLTFLDGQTWRNDPARRMWDFWDAVLRLPGMEPPVRLTNGLFEFGFDGQRKFVRPDTLDYGVFREVWEEDVYRLNGVSGLDTVVDLGGHVGMFVTRAAAISKRVICIEAFPDNLPILSRNIEGSGCASRITLLNRAIGASSGRTVEIFGHPQHSGAHSLDRAHVLAGLPEGDRQESALEVKRVETISLDDLFAQHSIETCDLLKCDIEGSEYETIAGASDATLRRVRRFTAELHGLSNEPTTRADELEARLKSLGFETERGPQERSPALQIWACMFHALQPK